MSIDGSTKMYEVVEIVDGSYGCVYGREKSREDAEWVALEAYKVEGICTDILKLTNVKDASGMPSGNHAWVPVNEMVPHHDHLGFFS